MQGTKLSCPLRDPEGLQQWLETETFMKTLWQWHKADVNIEGDIVPAKVLQIFRMLVENAVRTCHLSGELVKGKGEGSYSQSPFALWRWWGRGH